ncbi:hypothetical protein D3C81_1607820 [compost metagenome]
MASAVFTRTKVLKWSTLNFNPLPFPNGTTSPVRNSVVPSECSIYTPSLAGSASFSAEPASGRMSSTSRFCRFVSI